MDSRSLYDRLEKDIVPLYYANRSTDNIPTGWLARIKDSIATLAPQFSTRRMVREYIDQMYIPSMQPETEKVK